MTNILIVLLTVCLSAHTVVSLECYKSNVTLPGILQGVLALSGEQCGILRESCAVTTPDCVSGIRTIYQPVSSNMCGNPTLDLQCCDSDFCNSFIDVPSIVCYIDDLITPGSQTFAQIISDTYQCAISANTDGTLNYLVSRIEDCVGDIECCGTSLCNAPASPALTLTCYIQVPPPASTLVETTFDDPNRTLQCAYYNYLCTSTDTSCTAAEVAQNVTKAAYTVTSAATCNFLRALPTVSNLVCCNTSLCNVPQTLGSPQPSSPQPSSPQSSAPPPSSPQPSSPQPRSPQPSSPQPSSPQPSSPQPSSPQPSSPQSSSPQSSSPQPSSIPAPQPRAPQPSTRPAPIPVSPQDAQETSIRCYLTKDDGSVKVFKITSKSKKPKCGKYTVRCSKNSSSDECSSADKKKGTVKTMYTYTTDTCRAFKAEKTGASCCSSDLCISYSPPSQQYGYY